MNDKNKKITERLNVIAMAPNLWDGPWMNRQQLLSRLASKHNIVYTNGLWTVWERLQNSWKKALPFGRVRLQEGVLVDYPPKYFLRWPTIPAIDRFVIRLGVKRWIKAFCGKHGSRVAYLFHPQFFPYVSDLKPDYVVYHAYDMLSLTPGWNQELAQQQIRLLEIADLIVASSDVIADELASLSGKSVEVIPNGADFGAFSDVLKTKNSEPDDLADIAHPRIGYVGNLNLKVDFPLVGSLAKKHPNWSFVFVGGEGKLDDYTKPGIDECSKLENVHFLGSKDYKDIPRYVCNMDINLMCYRVGEGVWTRGIYPLKLHEYLASGLPVVSSEIPSVLPFSDQVAIARSSEQWETCINSALQGQGAGDFKSRRAVAKQNSWDARALRLNDCLSAMHEVKPSEDSMSPKKHQRKH